MSQIINLSRRDFLKAGVAGGGLVLGLYLPLSRRLAVAATESAEQFSLTPLVHIGADGSVTIVVGQRDFGSHDHCR